MVWFVIIYFACNSHSQLACQTKPIAKMDNVVRISSSCDIAQHQLLSAINFRNVADLLHDIHLNGLETIVSSVFVERKMSLVSLLLIFSLLHLSSQVCLHLMYVIWRGIGSGVQSQFQPMRALDQGRNKNLG